MKKGTLLILISAILMFPAFLLITGCGDDGPACTTIGAPCDDGNADTYNDAINSDCECVGTLNRFVDARDGQSYRTVKIGTQTWMKDNLNYITPESKCYDDQIDNCTLYGRLYHGVDAKSACPVGWHLPTSPEWTQLVDFLGGPFLAGGKMKEAGTEHWMAPNSGATNESGFTGLPAGFYASYVTDYLNQEEDGFWWSATHEDPDEQWFVILIHDSQQAVGDYDESYKYGLSVRCVRD